MKILLGKSGLEETLLYSSIKKTYSCKYIIPMYIYIFYFNFIFCVESYRLIGKYINSDIVFRILCFVPFPLTLDDCKLIIRALHTLLQC